jgi:hypothetical protein
MPQRFSVERAGRRFRVRELLAGGSRVSRGTFATEGEARARAAALEATPPAPEAPVTNPQPTPAWMPGEPPTSGPAASPSAPEVPPASSSPAGDDPFADAPRDQAQPSSAEAQGVEPSPPSSGPTRLGEAGARAYLPLLYGMADTVSCAGATWLLNRKLGEEGARRFLDQAHAVMRLSEVEKTALEAPLVHKLAQVELSPDDALLLAVLGIYAAKLVAMQTMVAQAEARVVTVEAVP